MSNDSTTYEAPRVTYYGTVEELTLGTGTSLTPDLTQCNPANPGFTAPPPISGFNCKPQP